MVKDNKLNFNKSLSLYNDVPLETWKQVLNDNMDYHFRDNLFDQKIFKDIDTILDIGCGWGGTMRDLKKLYDIEATGLTNSPQQYNYIGKNVILEDANTWESQDKWDLITFIQSFTHMDDRALLLRTHNTDKIFISDYYVKGDEPYLVHDWIMNIRTRDQYESLFDQMGFVIKSFTEFPHSDYESNARFWLDNIHKNQVTNGWQINVLERFCKGILTGRHRNIIMCDIYAERK